MKKNTLDFICCPECKKNLSLKILKQSAKEIQSGSLFCQSCSVEYPVVSEKGLYCWEATQSIAGCRP
ncbi:Trm112 family protein [candidate division WOR-3 bacterium]|nr:Trm112 family protein [candidate division WOR-3 bacterium]